MKLPLGFSRDSIVESMIKAYAGASPQLRDAGREQLRKTLASLRYPKAHPLAGDKGLLNRPIAAEHAERYARAIMDAVCAGDRERATRLFAEVNDGKIETHGHGG